MNKTRSKIMDITDEMSRGLNMPSEFPEDWEFPKTTPVTAKLIVIRQAERTNEQVRLWAAKLRYIANEL